MSSKVHELPNKEQDKLLADMEKSKRAVDALIGFTGHIAKLKRAQYLAYVSEGFTPEQALELCKG